MNSEDGQTTNAINTIISTTAMDILFTLFVYCNFLVLQSTTFCSQNINKQNVNIADETLTDYNFLRRYH